MSLISGSYSRLLWTGGAALLRDDMVENAAAVLVLVATKLDWGARRAIGLTALETTLDRWRRFREAVLHRLRLKDDILN